MKPYVQVFKKAAKKLATKDTARRALALLLLVAIMLPPSFVFGPAPRAAHAAGGITYMGGQSGNSAGTNSNNSVTFSLTGGTNSSPQAGDLVIVSFSNGDTTNNTLFINNPSGTAYTYFGGADTYQNGSSFDTNFISGYRFMPGTPETSVQLGGGDTSGGRAWTVHVFRGVTPNNPLDVAAVIAGTTGYHLANPGAVTPVTPGAIIYVAGAGATNTGANYVAGYLTGFQTSTGADTQDGDVGAGYVPWTSGAYAPAAFTGGGTDSSGDSWSAVTVALRPSTAPTVTSDAATNAAGTTATLNGSVSDTGGAAASTCGYAYSTDSTLATTIATTSDSTCPGSTGSFSKNVSSLTAGVTYYFRAYATNSVGTGYGSIASFTPVTITTTLGASVNGRQGRNAPGRKPQADRGGA